MNPLVKVAGAGAILMILAGGAYYKGYKDATLEAEAERIKAVERAIAQAKEQAKIDAEIIAAAAAQESKTQTKTRIITRTVVKHVEKPVYRDCRLDAIGLCIAREAAAGRDGTACTSGADDSLPAAGGPGE